MFRSNMRPLLLGRSYLKWATMFHPYTWILIVVFMCLLLQSEVLAQIADNEKVWFLPNAPGTAWIYDVVEYDEDGGIERSYSDTTYFKAFQGEWPIGSLSRPMLASNFPGFLGNVVVFETSDGLYARDDSYPEMEELLVGKPFVLWEARSAASWKDSMVLTYDYGQVSFFGDRYEALDVRVWTDGQIVVGKWAIGVGLLSYELRAGNMRRRVLEKYELSCILP